MSAPSSTIDQSFRRRFDADDYADVDVGASATASAPRVMNASVGSLRAVDADAAERAEARAAIAAAVGVRVLTTGDRQGTLHGGTCTRCSRVHWRRCARDASAEDELM